MKFFLLIMLFVFSLGMSVSQAQESVQYYPTTYKNMSQLSWGFGRYDPNDLKIIDQYARIHNCELHKKYFDNNFEWQRIRNGLSHNISLFSKDFPTRFEVKAAVPIARYDFDNFAFIIEEGYKLNNAGSIIIPVDRINYDRECVDQDIQYMFPSTIRFVADNKFSMTKIPVGQSEAQDILKFIADYDYRGFEGKNVIPVRFRIKVNGIQNVTQSRTGGSMVLFGQLDEIAFFQDPEMTMPIWSKSFKELD